MWNVKRTKYIFTVLVIILHSTSICFFGFYGENFSKIRHLEEIRAANVFIDTLRTATLCYAPLLISDLFLHFPAL